MSSKLLFELLQKATPETKEQKDQYWSVLAEAVHLQKVERDEEAKCLMEKNEKKRKRTENPRPLSKYQLFMKEEWAKVKQEMPEAESQEIFTTCVKRWHAQKMNELSTNEGSSTKAEPPSPVNLDF